jgi:very-short-patch-repair endonuclease
LRQNSTDAEARLWRRLKHLETRGSHFRRQMPIGNFVVDFACPAARVVIEVDGSQHGHGEVLMQDAKRTAWLEQEGYRVLRFWNNEVAQNIDQVMTAIYDALYGQAEPRKFVHLRCRRAHR